MKFTIQHIIFKDKATFTEEQMKEHFNKGVPNSTMDQRWFYTDHVSKLEVHKSIRTDFHKITRIE